MCIKTPSLTAPMIINILKEQFIAAVGSTKFPTATSQDRFSCFRYKLSRKDTLFQGLLFIMHK